MIASCLQMGNSTRSAGSTRQQQYYILYVIVLLNCNFYSEYKRRASIISRPSPAVSPEWVRRESTLEYPRIPISVRHTRYVVKSTPPRKILMTIPAKLTIGDHRHARNIEVDWNPNPSEGNLRRTSEDLPVPPEWVRSESTLECPRVCERARAPHSIREYLTHINPTKENTEDHRPERPPEFTRRIQVTGHIIYSNHRGQWWLPNEGGLPTLIKLPRRISSSLQIQSHCPSPGEEGTVTPIERGVIHDEGMVLKPHKVVTTRHVYRFRMYTLDTRMYVQPQVVPRLFLSIGSVRLRPGSSAEAKRGAKDAPPKELRFIPREWGYTWPIEVLTSTEQVKHADITRIQNAQENLRWHFKKPGWQFTLEADLLSAEVERKKIDPDIVAGHQGKQCFE